VEPFFLHATERLHGPSPARRVRDEGAGNVTSMWERRRERHDESRETSPVAGFFHGHRLVTTV